MDELVERRSIPGLRRLDKRLIRIPSPDATIPHVKPPQPF
jgi:hypothetical protein